MLQKTFPCKLQVAIVLKDFTHQVAITWKVNELRKKLSGTTLERKKLQSHSKDHVPLSPIHSITCSSTGHGTSCNLPWTVNHARFQAALWDE